MSEEVKNFIDAMADGKNDQAGEAFKDALKAKVGSQLDQHRKEVAANMFNGQIEPESFSDPKPEIADPGTFNPDGTVSLKADGKADIDLTQPSIAGVDIANDEGK